MGNLFDRMKKDVDRIVENQKKNEPRLKAMIDNVFEMAERDKKFILENHFNVWFKDNEAFITNRTKGFSGYEQLTFGTKEHCEEYCKVKNIKFYNIS